MEESESLPVSLFRCKQCRNILFSSMSLEAHQIALHGLRHAKGGSGRGLRCTSHFLGEPEEWMELTGSTSGKLYCPHCNSKIGSFDWSGSQCSCGTWVSPSIQILHSKVDGELVRNESEENEKEGGNEEEGEEEGKES